MNEVKEILECEKYDFKALVKIMKILRGKDGCPWDREQDHLSIRQNLIEETYEVIEAIDTDDPILLCEELGDLMLQVVFHACIEEEIGEFTIDNVINDICKKLIIRHPHIFSNVKVEGTGDVLDNWEKIKNEEKGRNDINAVLNSIPRALPALMRADKVLKKAGKSKTSISKNLNIDTIKNNCDKIAETSFNDNYKDNIIKEKIIGEMLMAIVNISREIGVDSEVALTYEVDEFVEKMTDL